MVISAGLEKIEHLLCYVRGRGWECSSFDQGLSLMDNIAMWLDTQTLKLIPTSYLASM